MNHLNDLIPEEDLPADVLLLEERGEEIIRDLILDVPLEERGEEIIRDLILDVPAHVVTVPRHGHDVSPYVVPPVSPPSTRPAQPTQSYFRSTKEEEEEHRTVQIHPIPRYFLSSFNITQQMREQFGDDTLDRVVLPHNHQGYGFAVFKTKDSAERAVGMRLEISHAQGAFTVDLRPSRRRSTA